MNFRIQPVLAMIALALVAAAPVTAAPVNGAAAMELLDQDRNAGRISAETWLLESFRYVFAPEAVSPRYLPANRTLIRCMTPRIAEFHRLRDSLQPAAVAEMDGYLTPSGAQPRAIYMSPSGIFEFAYQTTGANAVDPSDVDPANGIPDLVERSAEYADYTWVTEVDTLAFKAPTLTAGVYEMSYESMGAYGYTTPTGAGKTRIVLHNTFTGFFPPNTDPDGPQLGRAKVTIAHEFKHASQYTNSSWSEGGWVELDATWMEDIVYDDTNDLYNYFNALNGGSQLSNPEQSLDEGGSGSYEDCLWQLYMSEKHGVQIITDFWDLRAANSGWTMRKSYSEILTTYGSSWNEAYPEFMEWCWFTGSRAELPYGFGESPDYLRMRTRTGNVSTYPANVSDNVAHLATHPRRYNPGSATDHPRILFNGDDAHTNFTVSVIAEKPDGSFTIVQPAVDANQDFDYTVPTPFQSLLYVAVLVTNTKRTGSEASYSYTVEDATGSTGIGELVTADAGLRLHPAAPNPTSGVTTLSFSLPADASHAEMGVFDVHGRLVRALHHGPLSAGHGEARWDGTDHSGRRTPAGVYWIRLHTDDGSTAARRVTLVR